MDTNFEFQHMNYIIIYEWVKEQNLRTEHILNPYFDTSLERDSIDWEILSSHPNATKLLEATVRHDQIDWMNVANNPCAVNLIKAVINVYDLIEDFLGEYSYDVADLRYNYLALILMGKLLPQPSLDLFDKYFIPMEFFLKNYPEDEYDDPREFLWSMLCMHPTAIDIIKPDIEYYYIDWTTLSHNTAAIELLETHIDKIDWDALSYNPAARKLLEDNLDKVNWDNASLNPSMADMFHLHLNEINWDRVSNNSSKYALLLMKNHIDKLNWTSIALNTTAFVLLESYPERINWNLLSLNPSAIPMLEKNLEKINWTNLSRNPGAIELIKKHLDLIDQFELRSNPNIVTYDYKRIKQCRKDLNRELHEYSYHPSRIAKWIDTGNDPEDYLQ